MRSSSRSSQSTSASDAAERTAEAVATALAGGDPSRLGAKLPVRRRLELLLDPGSWVEDGLLASALREGYPADGVLTGTGTVDGRPVAVIAHDPTVKAGSWGGNNCEKQIRILERADRELLPVFYLVDSAGGRLTEQLDFFPGRRGAGRIFHMQIELSGRVPQICCLFGPSAAGGAYMPSFCDWVGMVEGQASMYLASPRIAERAIGEKVTLEEMGGARMHCTVSGCGDELFPDDASLIERARALLGYLPRSWQDPPPEVPAASPAAEDWTGVIADNPRAGYEVREVVRRLADDGTFLEIKERYAPELVVGLGRIRGRVTGFVANQPSVKAGVLFVDSADKAARFILLCDAFNIPLVFLVDVPGFMVGAAVERQGIIRHGAKMLSVMASAGVPRICVVLRKAYGAGLYAMSGPGFRPTAVLALPTAEIGAMSPSAGVNAVYAKKLEEMTDDEERARFVAEREAEFAAEIDVVRLASDLVVDAVVRPEDLRNELAVRLAAAAGTPRPPARKHRSVTPV
jgi:acetyl-CoA carboxylase carboxyltransferase component